MEGSDSTLTSTWKVGGWGGGEGKMKHPNKKKEISNSSTDYFDHSISVPVNKIFNYLYQVVFNPLSTMLTDTMKIQHKAHGAKVSQLL